MRTDDRLHYMSSNYAPEKVVQRTIRYLSPAMRDSGDRQFRVYDIAANHRTLREYDTHGADVPETILTEAVRVGGHLAYPL